MTVEAGPLRARLREWLYPLRRTPFHPQWFIERSAQLRLAWVQQHAHGRTLDIGCADGALASSLRAATDYIGVDYPVTATGLYRTRPHVFCDAAQLPFADAAFDTVLLLDTLEHISRPDEAVLEAARVLKCNGKLLIAIPFCYPVHDAPHDYQRLTEFGLRNRLERAGLVVNEVQKIGGGVEAGSLSVCVSVSQSAINAFEKKSWKIIFAPLVIFVVPAINIWGWFLSQLFPENQLQPLAYYVIAERNEAADITVSDTVMHAGGIS